MSADESTSDFYVGYLRNAPPTVARFVCAGVVLVLLMAAALAALVAVSQASWQPGVFEFGVERSFAGTYLHSPCAQLRVARPGRDGGWSRWLLVQPGKHGAAGTWSEFDGREVALRGSLVYRGEGTLIEVVPGSLHALAGDSSERASTEVRELGRVRLTGEIVDSKCWLGVMNPGNLRTHRACATLCVRGGIPPLLVVREAEGPSRQVLLVGPHGEAVNQAVLPWIAIPVEIEGQLTSHDELLVLRADPASIRALE